MKRILIFLFLISAFGSMIAKDNNEISVLQFNIWQEGTVIEGGFDAIANEVARLDPDFVTFSEVRNYNNTSFCDRITDALAERGKKYYSFYSNDTVYLANMKLPTPLQCFLSTMTTEAFTASTHLLENMNLPYIPGIWII